MEAGKFTEAAEIYADPMHSGAALYRAGAFKDAAAVFNGVLTPEGFFNRGNALLFQGEYEEAMKAYDQALLLKPRWKEAEENREIAKLRGERLKQEGGEGTGGKLEADDYVFGEKGETGSPETVEMDGGAKLSDEELRALWLRKVQTRPKDFLRSKFAYQYAQQKKVEGK